MVFARVTSALAAAPENLDLEDISAWEAASQQLFDGPPGCREIVGHAAWAYERFTASWSEKLL